MSVSFFRQRVTRNGRELARYRTGPDGWVDRDGNGTIEISRDINDNGVIEAGQSLPWGADEGVARPRAAFHQRNIGKVGGSK